MVMSILRYFKYSNFAIFTQQNTILNFSNGLITLIKLIIVFVVIVAFFKKNV